MPSRINHQAYIEYTKPENRTSTYIGHRSFSEVPIGDFTRSITGCRHEKVPPPYDYETTQQAAYKPLYKDPEISTNPHLVNTKIFYIKNYEDKKYNHAPKSLEEYDTIYRQQYSYKTEVKQEPVPKMYFGSSVDKSDVLINAELPGCSKYLDLMASSNMLNYPVYSEHNRRGIAARNNITVWNWNGSYQKRYGLHIERPETMGDLETMCEKLSAPMCPKRRNEFPSRVRNVPHGMQPESRKYQIPVETIDFNLDKLTDNFVFISPNTTPPWTKESSIIGSSECISRYVDTGNKNI